MEQPYGRCDECGERLYEHIDGGYRCANCGERYGSDAFDADERSSKAC